MREKTTKSTQPFTEALKKAIRDSEMSFLGLEAATGVKRQSLMKFMRGEQSLQLDYADRLADYFGMKVSQRKKGK